MASSHPYPPYAHVEDFVSIKLSKTNYYTWQKPMFHFIKLHSLDGFINGHVSAPPEKIDVPADDSSSLICERDNPKYQEWNIGDELVRGWILATLGDDDIRTRVESLRTAQDMSTTLEKEQKAGWGINRSRYLPLLKAVMDGNREETRKFLEKADDGVRVPLTADSSTALMLAFNPFRGYDLVKEIVDMIAANKVREREKMIHHEALKLVKFLCMEIVKLDSTETLSILGEALKIAACDGIHEVVEEIFYSFPTAIYYINDMDQSVLHLAIVHRHANVFNILYQVGAYFSTVLELTDKSNNNGLHLAGCLNSQGNFNLRVSAAGAALQMQRELQWFKEVEKFISIQDQDKKNIDGKTPAMIFNERHRELVKEGEKWMKDTANSCIIVAALIVTIMFAAAITVPGGTNDATGLPFFAREKAFIIFAISNALALFTSISSLLMFLSILTSRYAEEDFLFTLPNRLIIGLATLFLSILFMMIAFGATLKILFGDKDSWILIPVVALACIPITLFASLQFPLLVVMIKFTYGPGMFGKQHVRRFSYIHYRVICIAFLRFPF